MFKILSAKVYYGPNDDLAGYPDKNYPNFSDIH